MCVFSSVSVNVFCEDFSEEGVSFFIYPLVHDTSLLAYEYTYLDYVEGSVL